MKLLSFSLSVAILAFALTGCNGSASKVEEEVSKGFVELPVNQLEKFGIFIVDTAVMYNNAIEGVGSLDIVIRDKSYFGNSSTIEQTNLGFYPRYITTVDTVQRSMYMISGNQAKSDEEARKWQSFESLVPMVVHQVYNDSVFGETLIFWMTKTPELESLLKEENQ